MQEATLARTGTWAEQVTSLILTCRSIELRAAHRSNATLAHGPGPAQQLPVVIKVGPA